MGTTMTAVLLGRGQWKWKVTKWKSLQRFTLVSHGGSRPSWRYSIGISSDSVNAVLLC